MKDKQAPSEGVKSGGTINSTRATASFSPSTSGPTTRILFKSSYDLFGLSSKINVSIIRNGTSKEGEFEGTVDEGDADGSIEGKLEG